MCPLCGDRGVFRLDYRDGSPFDYVLCACPLGLQVRQPGRSWADVRAMLAARDGIDPDRVQLAEEALDAEDWPVGMGPSVEITAGDFTKAGKTKRARL